MRTKQVCLLSGLMGLAVILNGCVILYLPHTYYLAETSAITSPFQTVSASYDTNAPSSPLKVSLGDANPGKLAHLRFVSATMTNENGSVSQLQPRWQTLENPNSFVLTFYKAEYLDHDLHLNISLLLNSKPVVVTFQTHFKSKVYWPKDSDYNG